MICRNPLLLLLLLLLAGCASPPTAAPPPEAAAAIKVDDQTRHQFAAAVAAHQQGDSATAEALWLQLTHSQPQIGAPWYNLGLLALAKGDLALAARSCSGAIAAEPKVAANHHLCGRVARAEGNFAAAQSAYSQGLALAPADPDLLLDSGVVAEIYQGDLATALDRYRRYVAAAGPEQELVTTWIALLEASTASPAEEPAAPVADGENEP